MGFLKRLFNERETLQARAASKDSIKNTPREVYDGLRNLALTSKAEDFSKIGLVGEHGVYGVLMEMGQPEGVVSLSTFITGDTSLYFSTGGGIIGGIGHDSVKNAAIEFNKKADEFIHKCNKVTAFPLPKKNETIFYILTKEAVYAAKGMDNDLVDNKSFFSPLYEAGQEVITNLRLVNERREDAKKGRHYDEGSWFGEAGYANCLLTLMAEGKVKSTVIDSKKTLPSLDIFAEGSSHLTTWIKSQKVFYEEVNSLEVCKVLLSSAGYEKEIPFTDALYIDALLIPTADNASKDGIPTIFKIESIDPVHLVLRITIVKSKPD